MLLFRGAERTSAALKLLQSDNKRRAFEKLAIDKSGEFGWEYASDLLIVAAWHSFQARSLRLGMAFRSLIRPSMIAVTRYTLDAVNESSSRHEYYHSCCSAKPTNLARDQSSPYRVGSPWVHALYSPPKHLRVLGCCYSSPRNKGDFARFPLTALTPQEVISGSRPT